MIWENRRHIEEQGRTHYKEWHFKKITFCKSNRAVRYTGADYDTASLSEEYGYMNLEIKCRMPEEKVRYKTNIGPYDGSIRIMENNWKEKKIRHQWQAHKRKPNKKRYENVFDKIYNEESCLEYDEESISYLSA